MMNRVSWPRSDFVLWLQCSPMGLWSHDRQNAVESRAAPGGSAVSASGLAVAEGRFDTAKECILRDRLGEEPGCSSA